MLTGVDGFDALSSFRVVFLSFGVVWAQSPLSLQAHKRTVMGELRGKALASKAPNPKAETLRPHCDSLWGSIWVLCMGYKL